MSTSRALEPFGTTVFTVYSRLAHEAGAVNLGQGFPDFESGAIERGKTTVVKTFILE